MSDKELEAVRGQIKCFTDSPMDVVRRYSELLDTLAELRAEVERLRDALKPIVGECQGLRTIGAFVVSDDLSTWPLKLTKAELEAAALAVEVDDGQ